MPEHSKKLADAIKNARRELGWTQEALAENSGTEVRTIINMEMGRGNPKLKTLYAIIRALKLDAREIFDDEPVSESPTTRHLRMIFDECNEDEAAILLPVVEAILNALRSKQGISIK